MTGKHPYTFFLIDVLTANSIPIVYYGQEQGLEGGGDPVRMRIYAVTGTYLCIDI